MLCKIASLKMLGFAFITKLTSLLKYGRLPSLWSLLLPNPKLISQPTILGQKKLKTNSPSFGAKIQISQKLEFEFSCIVYIHEEFF